MSRIRGTEYLRGKTPDPVVSAALKRRRRDGATVPGTPQQVVLRESQVLRTETIIQQIAADATDLSIFDCILMEENGSILYDQNYTVLYREKT